MIVRDLSILAERIHSISEYIYSFIYNIKLDIYFLFPVFKHYTINNEKTLSV